jgi:signal transduction histidine kinase
MRKRSGFKLPHLVWRGFPFQYFLFMILPLTTLLLAVAFGSLSLHRQEMRSLVGDRDLRAVRAAANSLNQELNHQTEVLKILTETNPDESQLARLVNNPTASLSSFDRGLVLISPTGQAIAASPAAKEWMINSPEFRSTLTFFEKGGIGTPALSSLVRLDPSGSPAILAGIVLPGKSVLIGGFNPGTLIQSGLEGTVNGAQVTAFVVAPDGQVLYHVGNLTPQEHLKTHPGIAEALKGESGINYYPTPEGEHVVAFSPVGTSGWGLMMEESWEMIASPLLNTTQMAPLILVPVLILALVALWFATRQIVQPLQLLERRTEELANGNFEAIQQPVGGISEIRHLQSELIDMANKLNLAQESLHRYIGAITGGIENERRNLARELHDDTIQTLIALNQRLQLSNLAGKNSSFQENAKDLLPLVQGAMTNLRRIIRGLRPIYLEDLGLVAALEMLCQETSQTSPLPVNFKVEGSECRLVPEIELAFYRMAQEALSNIVRHADASQASVDLNYQGDSVTLRIKDNGKGFKASPQSNDLVQQGHFGLLGLRERAELIDADLQILSDPGKGTIITIHLDQPTSSKEREAAIDNHNTGSETNGPDFRD